MPVSVRYITDPACSASWAAEPSLRKLTVEFGEEVEFTYVMGGLQREYGAEDQRAMLVEWLERAEDGMPLDPLLWEEGPLNSSYPACMAVKAAAEQDRAGDCLRSLREGLMCFRRKLDTSEALVEEARRAGLNVERFRVDLGSHAIVEAFGTDLEEARAVPPEAHEHDGVASDGSRVVFPTLHLEGPAGEAWVFGPKPYEHWRAAALAAGASPSGGGPLAVLEALRRFGRMATAELEAVCELPGPRAHAELWALATDWKVKPVRVLTGWLWEPA